MDIKFTYVIYKNYKTCKCNYNVIHIKTLTQRMLKCTVASQDHCSTFFLPPNYLKIIQQTLLYCICQLKIWMWMKKEHV